MKTATIALACLTVFSFAPVFAQGSLTPPAGAPAPVMKTLDQVEARIPLIDAQPGVSVNGVGTITINDSGSYYLTGNVKIVDANAHGIEVLSSNVSIDLNGYTLICNTVNGGDAIHIPGASNVRIRNGHIDGGTIFTGSTFSPSGWNNGVLSTEARTGLVVSDLTVRGTREHGIYLDEGQSRVERCSVSIAPGTGIFAATVIDSTVIEGGATGILAVSANDLAVVDNCIAQTVVFGGTAIASVFGSVSNSQVASLRAATDSMQEWRSIARAVQLPAMA